MSISLKSGFTWRTITTAGWAGHGATPPQATASRNFLLGIPPSPPSPVNVIVDLHGGGSTPWKWFGYSKSSNTGDLNTQKYGEFPWDMWWSSLGYKWIVVAPLGAGLDPNNHSVIKTTSDLSATPTDVADNTSWNAESTGQYIQGTTEIIRMYDRQFILDILSYIRGLGYTIKKVAGHGHSKGAICCWTQFAHNDIFDFVCISAGSRDCRTVPLVQNNPKPFGLFIGDLDGYDPSKPGIGIGWPNGANWPAQGWFHYSPLLSIQETASAAGCTDVGSSTSIVCNVVDPTDGSFSANQTVVTGGTLVYDDSSHARILYTGGLAPVELGILRNEPHNIPESHRLVFILATDFIARQFGDK